MMDDQFSGTRFRLYPQAPEVDDDGQPETVYVSSPAGSLGPGPQDARMYAVNTIGKQQHYGMHKTGAGEPYLFLPPWGGEIHMPPEPGPDGHFDHLEPGTPQFDAAHLFGAARFTLDVWERYFDRPIAWHFGEDFDRLELSIMPAVDNAFMGWGFLEAGAAFEDGASRPYWLNFDVIAHEIGHGIIYSEVGMPVDDIDNAEYFGFHESAADLSAMIASLHFDSVVNGLLDNTSGNLYSFNRLNRFAETTESKQIRVAANDSRLSDFAAGWDSEHKLSQPLTGAMFDVLIDVFHENLLDAGLIPPEMEDLSDRLEGDPRYGDILQGQFDALYGQNPQGFKDALLLARDYLGTYLADAWRMLDPRTISYKGVGNALIDVDEEITGGRFARIIKVNFEMRDIGFASPGPRLAKPDKDSHVFSDRTVTPRNIHKRVSA
jgi:hypothetical protein